MFYYYGRKKRLAGFYPAPKHDVIVEPFAGSASYSLFEENWRKQVVLVERDPQIAALWRWLIQDATVSNFETYPDPVEGKPTSDLLHILCMASKRWHTYRNAKATSVMLSNWAASKRYMMENLHKVKHWTLIEGDYSQAPDSQATWFIDPPYQGEPGTGYRFGSPLIDYNELSVWVRSRRGQVIACDHPQADWLPFETLCETTGVAGKSHVEGIFYRDDGSGQDDFQFDFTR